MNKKTKLQKTRVMWGFNPITRTKPSKKIYSRKKTIRLLMNNFIIAYDIFDPKRLRKVKQIVYSYSLGGQKSAIEAPLDKQSLKMLLTELSQEVHKVDKVNIIKVVGEPILLGCASNISYENNGVIIL